MIDVAENSVMSLPTPTLRTARLRLRPFIAKSGVRINVVAPGPIETPMTDRMFGGAENLNSMMSAVLPVGRAGKPEEIASAVLWLSSPGAFFYYLLVSVQCSS